MTYKFPGGGSGTSVETEEYQFVVVCPTAREVYLLGPFNDWSTTATPMEQTEENVFQVAVRLPVGQTRFSYFVIDRKFGTGRGAFGSTYLMPGTWAAVARQTLEAALPTPSRVWKIA